MLAAVLCLVFCIVACGGNITSGGSGIIKPPNYPLKYQTRTVCDWYIYRSNPLAQIKIKFEDFDIEGTMKGE